MTPFEKVIEQLQSGEKTAPIISYNGHAVDAIKYQLATTKFELSINAKGLKPNRFWRLKDIKDFYGLKGKDGKAVLDDFMTRIYNRYIPQ